MCGLRNAEERGGPEFNMPGQVIGSVTGMAPENIDQTLTAEDLEIAADLCCSDGHEHDLQVTRFDSLLRG